MTVVETRLQENVLISTINSGKGNPLSPEVLQNLDEALTRSEQDDEIGSWLILGQPGLLSGGFDLSIMLGGSTREITGLVHQGGSLFARMYASPTPIIVGATGHAVAGGAKDAGFLDSLVEEHQVESAALEEAQRLGSLNAKSYAATIKLTRGTTVNQLHKDLAADRDFIDSLED